jgi:hypothetical protein
MRRKNMGHGSQQGLKPRIILLANTSSKLPDQRCCAYSERPTTPLLLNNGQCFSFKSSKQVAHVWYNQSFVYPQMKKPMGVKPGDLASVWQNFQGS